MSTCAHSHTRYTHNNDKNFIYTIYTHTKFSAQPGTQGAGCRVCFLKPPVPPCPPPALSPDICLCFPLTPALYPEYPFCHDSKTHQNGSSTWKSSLNAPGWITPVFCELVSVQASGKPLLRVLANNGNGSDELPELQDPGRASRFVAVAVCSGLKTTALGPPIAYFCLPLSGLCSQETSGFHPACFGPVKYSSKHWLFWPLWRFSLACCTAPAKGSQSSVVMTEF